MNFYEYITENKKVVNTLFHNGVLSFNILTNLSIYQYYLDMRELGYSKSLSITSTSDKNKVSIKTVYNIINQFEVEV